MSLFEDASLIITPNGRKASKIYALKPFNGSGDLTVVRATTATEVNSSGVIVDVASNVARFDYTNGSCPSILVEPQRTNLVFPSATATTQSRTVTAVAHTLSFYGTGSITLSGVATGTLVGTGVSNRVTLTFTPTAGSLTLTVTGSVTNWQLEAGANATSYIRTVSSAVTRNADVISKGDLKSLGLIGTSGSWFFELRDNKATSGDSNVQSMSISDNGIGTNNAISTIGFPLIIRTRQGASFSNSYTTSASNSPVKVVITWNLTNINYYVNGVKVLNNGLFDSSSINILHFGSNNGTRNINNMALFPTQLTDQECIDLTTL